MKELHLPVTPREEGGLSQHVESLLPAAQVGHRDVVVKRSPYARQVQDIIVKPRRANNQQLVSYFAGLKPKQSVINTIGNILLLLIYRITGYLCERLIYAKVRVTTKSQI